MRTDSSTPSTDRACDGNRINGSGIGRFPLVSFALSLGVVNEILPKTPSPASIAPELLHDRTGFHHSYFQDQFVYPLTHEPLLLIVPLPPQTGFEDSLPQKANGIGPHPDRTA